MPEAEPHFYSLIWKQSLCRLYMFKTDHSTTTEAAAPIHLHCHMYSVLSMQRPACYMTDVNYSLFVTHLKNNHITVETNQHWKDVSYITVTLISVTQPWNIKGAFQQLHSCQCSCSVTERGETPYCFNMVITEHILIQPLLEESHSVALGCLHNEWQK